MKTSIPRNSHVLVTGAAGFIGKHVCRALHKLGYKIIATDNKDPESPSKNYKYYNIELSNYSDFKKITESNIQYIFHLGAQSTGYFSQVDHQHDADSNAKGTSNVCQFSREKSVKKIIYTSSMAVYGNGSWRTEGSPLCPVSNYGVSKLSGEFYIKTLQQYGINHSIFRLWNTYGPGQNLDNPRNGILSVYLAQAINGKTINVTGKLDRFRDLVYIEDTVNALLLGLKDHTDNEIYNVCNAKEVTVKEMIDCILEIHEDDRSLFEVKNIGAHDGDQTGSSGDNQKLIAAGWTPQFKLINGVKLFYEWAKKQ
jgi:UDP-glucose 4-epimerase